ncbi:uncharacterized protein [Spinacia oleracea]|uniref:ATP-dependent DNA helicase n=1 Tax=Spinacia oleracea TaxID=3562 RepID=A0A9R0J665_SPIOL|nr:uncharacterized protein LOC110800959 [Spinacia oleracea]
MRGHYKYGYPKKFAAETTNSSDGYPLYKRIDTGESVCIRRVNMDNRSVIPYNPYLLSLFDCHLNVEVCSTIMAVKYLYKYVYKGHDKITFNVVQDGSTAIVDEIQQYQAGRWVSPCEAACRIFGFDMFEMSPSVLPLQIYLPNLHTIQVMPHENLDEIISNDKRSRTQLTEFFRMNAATPDGTGYTLTFVAPAEGERYFLKLLLMHVDSPRSFDHLRTVDGYKCATFQETALRLKLLEEDNDVDLCLAEACEVQMPTAFRQLFSTVLIFCQTSDPNALWLKYYDALSEDFRHQFLGSDSKSRELTVRSVEQSLEAMGKPFRDFGLQHLNDFQDEEFRRTKDIIDALDALIPQDCIDARNTLNQAQQEAFDSIIDHVLKGKPGAFFIDGPGGIGKTFQYNALYAEVRLMNKIVLPTATSGIAASNIPFGRTAHSQFKIPIDSDASLACDVPKQGNLACLIKETSLII